MLTNHYGADLELSLNLWLCADGKDTIWGDALTRATMDPAVLGGREKAGRRPGRARDSPRG